MTASRLGPRRPIGPLPMVVALEVSYVPGDGAEHRVPITQAAWAVPLEDQVGGPRNQPTT